jgi:bla regulator protein BlaR1
MNRLLVIGLLAGAVLSANEQAGAQQTYEAAVIKRSAVKDLREVVPGMFLSNGQWSARGATLSLLLRSAYAIPGDRIIGLPSWASSERFDIVTTPAPKQPLKQLQAMARQLLADRFGLQAHYEQRVNEVFALIRVEASGMLGPGLRPSASRCRHTSASATETSDLPSCQEAITSPNPGMMRYEFRDRPLVDLLIISGASQDICGPIVDRTGLTGQFDIDLEWTPRRSLEQSRPEFGAYLAEAFVEQLGLRFERRREPSDVLVLDRATMPPVD